MKPEAQRIAIAEACGWVTDCGYENSLKDNVFYGSCPDQNIKWQKCPDYLNDLNAMHEAEKVLDEPSRSIGGSSRPQDHAAFRYLSELSKLCGMVTRKEMVVSCPEQFRPAFDKVMKNGPPFKLPFGVGILSHSIPAYGYETVMIRATASQRAEAFLRTIGKWV